MVLVKSGTNFSVDYYIVRQVKYQCYKPEEKVMLVKIVEVMNNRE